MEKSLWTKGHGFSRAIFTGQMRALQAAEKLGFVSGHDFSRAVNDGEYVGL
jgi:hypothetical protein